MSHIAIPDESEHQLHGGITNRGYSKITFCGSDPRWSRARALYNGSQLLGEMTGGIAMISEISWQ